MKKILMKELDSEKPMKTLKGPARDAESIKGEGQFEDPS